VFFVAKPIREPQVEYDDFGFVKDYVCSSCGNRVKESHVDDIGTRFFKCEKCGLVSAKPKSMAKEKLLEPAIQALNLLKDPKFLYKIKNDMDETIKGEDQNKLLCWLLGVSCRTKDYPFVDVIGESAVGKTNMMRETLKYVPSQWYRKVGRITRTAIDYLKDQDFYLLWIQEVRGGEEAAPSIRLQSVDDGGLAAWVTERDKETGKFMTNEYHIPGRSVFSTTTNVSFSPEDATRTWLISADSSEDQTKRIIKYKLEKAKEPPELLEALGKKSEDLAPIVRQALEMLDWDVPVVIPYADDLSSLFSPRLVRVRRDVDKFLGLIRIIARLHQFQRPIVQINGKRFIVVAAPDALIAFQLGGKSLEETLTGLEKRLREVYDAVKELGNATSTQVGVKIHRGSEYARRALRVLVEMGYVDVDESQKTHMYSVRQTENPSSDLQGLQRTFSGSELQKKVDSFLFSISSQPPADGVDSGIGWKKGYFDPVNGIWVDLETTGPLPLEVERRYAPTAIDIKTVAGVHALDPITSGECPLCKRKDQNLVWQVSFFDESRIDACCMDCGGYLKDELQKRDKVAS
jgi:DNA-directed RNA polymerase subunit RPC12/RpoP